MGIEYNAIETEYGGHALDIAQTVDFDSYDAICCIGGDGTAHETVNGMMKRKDGKRLPLGIIPGGTGNSLLEDFKMADDFKLALNAIAKGTVIDFDCGLIELLDVEGNEKEIYMINMLGLGLAIEAAINADDLRPCCCCCCCCSQFAHAMRYKLGALWEIIKGTEYEISMDVDEQKTESVDFNAFFVMNTKNMGSKMKITPNALVDDGLFDIFYANPMDRSSILKMFDQIEKGTIHDTENADIIQKQCMKLKIEGKEKLKVNIDGEYAGTTPLTLTVINKAFQIYVI